MTFEELRISGARDAFGCLFRDWHVKGWEDGNPPEGSVCWLPLQQLPTPACITNTKKPQLELF